VTATRRAVIDIGTNSVKLLVADVQASSVIPFLECSEQTRLGKGFYPHHILRPDAIDHTAEVVSAYQKQALQAGALTIRILATSAVREAQNQMALTERISLSTRLAVEVLSGEQEAELAFRGIATDPRLARHPLVIVDVGGGSTQIIFHAGDGNLSHHSYRLGAVRLWEQIQPSDPPLPAELERCHQWLEDFIDRHIRPDLSGVLLASHHVKALLVAIGGTSTVLALMHRQLTTFNRSMIEDTVLTLDQVQKQLQELWHRSLLERRQAIGLPSNKADVILTGVAIHESLMRFFKFNKLYTSTRGLRFGAIGN
jgi:exopolyphosphatase / guanosine-5'-triphosphate,3'-diphosphate pyrophosphatase